MEEQERGIQPDDEFAQHCERLHSEAQERINFFHRELERWQRILAATGEALTQLQQAKVMPSPDSPSPIQSYR